MGPRRSLVKAAKDVGKSPATLTDQSKKNRWVDRAEAWDEMMDARRREQIESDILRSERAEAQLGTAMTTIAARRVLGDPRNNIPALDAAQLDASETARLAEVGIKIRRLAHGQPTDVMRGHHTVTSNDLKVAVEGVYEILMRHVPEDRQPRAASEVELFFQTGQVPG